MDSRPRPKKFHLSYSKPKPPKPGKVKYKYTVLGTASNRAMYFRNTCQEDEYDDREEDKDGEVIAIHPQHSMNLKEVNALLKEQGLKDEDIYFTASFDDDYLVLELVHIHQMSEQEKTEEYKEELAEWEEQQKRVQEYEEQRIQMEMENLKRCAAELEKKK